MSKLNLGLFAHVQESIEEIINFKLNKGRVVIPTGGGKTAIEAHSLRLKGLSDDFKVHLILSPRIVLTNQLIKSYRGYIGHNYLAMAFHSGKEEPDYETVKWEEMSTTSIEVVKEQVERSKVLNKNLVIFSTYHSAYKLINDFNFGMVIADESQYCVQENFFDTITNLRAEFKLFCTATEKHIETTKFGRGLNNESVYGPIIYRISAAELISRGIIVPPRIHCMQANKVSSGTNSILDEVINVAKKQHELTTADGMKFSKILFAMNGTDDIRKIIVDINKVKAALPTHKIFTIMSNDKFGAMIDGSKMIQVIHAGQIWENKISRSIFFQQLRETDNALIFHYDIISEGIDIDGITGVVINRCMSLSKLLQTIGRAVRIYKADPSAKKQAWVTVSVIDGDIENREWIKSVLRDIRSGGFSIENIKFTTNTGPGIDDPDLPDQFNTESKGTLQTTITDIVHEIELCEYIDKLSGLSDDEFLKECPF